MAEYHINGFLANARVAGNRDLGRPHIRAFKRALLTAK